MIRFTLSAAGVRLYIVLLKVIGSDINYAAPSGNRKCSGIFTCSRGLPPRTSARGYAHLRTNRNERGDRGAAGNCSIFWNPHVLDVQRR